ncbi:MAG: NAD(P)/FAD-dependent oxidoreductase [Thermoplasmata archaeon]
MRPWDIAIIGGGILGTTAAYWLAARYEARIAVLEQEADVAQHASGRNTGVLHRPFYLHPRWSRRFARSTLLSYDLWKAYARTHGLPWKPVGTLKLAIREDQLPTLHTYLTWAKANGLTEDEVTLLDEPELRGLEPNVRAVGALHAKRETSVDFGGFTRQLRNDASGFGVQFLTGRRVVGLAPTRDGLRIDLASEDQPHQARYVLNCAGGEAVDLAHRLGVGTRYADLHFRGEYWRVAPQAQELASTNLYPVAQFPEFPFLDPHWIVRASGAVGIGPNAVPVSGPWTYRGFSDRTGGWARKFLEDPLPNKGRLLRNPTFLRLALGESLGSLSPLLIADRVRRFLPTLPDGALTERGVAGVRSAVIDPDGQFVKEVLELPGPNSLHILNYNSPGASGAPAYTASLIARAAARGDLDHLRVRAREPEIPWDFENTVAELEGPVE